MSTSPDDCDREEDRARRNRCLETAGGTGLLRQDGVPASDAFSPDVRSNLAAGRRYLCRTVWHNFQQLTEACIDLPDPDTIDDEQTTSKL
jgi:hypothetical protein